MNSRSLIRRPFGYNYSNITLWIIAVNVLVMAAEYIVPQTLAYLAMTPVLVLNGFVWQPFTYMFVHDPHNLTHILFNMLGLLFFGTAIEREMGSKEFLLYYLLTGTLAGVFSFAAYLFLGGAFIPLLGASGAVYAVLVAFATLQPESQILIWGIIPVRAPVLVIGYAALDLASQLFVHDGVAHLTHLAGFGFGWLYFLARFGINPWTRFFRGR